jgi:mRNA-degrading endonuclease RelE of RelBE toxin-antitoxin system
MYKFKYAKKFEKSVKKLPKDVAATLAKQLKLLESDPHHNFLYTKKNHDAFKYCKGNYI